MIRLFLHVFHVNSCIEVTYQSRELKNITTILLIKWKIIKNKHPYDDAFSQLGAAFAPERAVTAFIWLCFEWYGNVSVNKQNFTKHEGKHCQIRQVCEIGKILEKSIKYGRQEKIWVTYGRPRKIRKTDNSTEVSSTDSAGSVDCLPVIEEVFYQSLETDSDTVVTANVDLYVRSKIDCEPPFLWDMFSSRGHMFTNRRWGW